MHRFNYKKDFPRTIYRPAKAIVGSVCRLDMDLGWLHILSTLLEENVGRGKGTGGMSKSNHQKHGFVVLPKAFRRDKNFISIKSFIAKNLKEAKWNGKPVRSLFSSEVGRIEEVRFIETGGQL